MIADETHPSAVPGLSGLHRVHEEITERGYALTAEWDIGLPPKSWKYFQGKYFDGGQLRCDPGDRPADRERARDVILYEWEDGELILGEYETIAIRDRSGIKGERIHKRIELLADRQFRELVKIFLSLLPEDRRQQKGTFGINLFRTHTDVVTKPHRDDEEFIMIYVLDREGDGAESYLYHQDEADGTQDSDPVFWKQLNPGDLLIFDDSRFKHGATPLTPPPGGRARRDVIICTVDYPTTYLQREPVSQPFA